MIHTDSIFSCRVHTECVLASPVRWKYKRLESVLVCFEGLRFWEGGRLPYMHNPGYPRFDWEPFRRLNGFTSKKSSFVLIWILLSRRMWTISREYVDASQLGWPSNMVGFRVEGLVGRRWKLCMSIGCSECYTCLVAIVFTCCSVPGHAKRPLEHS